MTSHGETQRKHEALYRRTVDNAVAGVRQKQYHEQSVPRILDGLRVELQQCIELLLISPEFYEEQLAKLDSVSEHANA